MGRWVWCVCIRRPQAWLAPMVGPSERAFRMLCRSHTRAARSLGRLLQLPNQAAACREWISRPLRAPCRVYMSCRVSRSLREGGIVRTRDGTAPCPGVLAAEVAGVAAGVAATEALTSSPTTRSTKRFMVS